MSVVSGALVRAVAVVGLIAAAAPSCAIRGTGPTPAVSSLVVRNRGFLDVNVYAVPSSASTAIRLGTVVGTSTTTFPLHSQHLQPGDILVLRLRAIGGSRTWTSPSVSVGEGTLAILDVNTDPSGDCSTSVLHTINTVDTVAVGIR